MYECATGRVPFDGDDAISVALKQVNELPVPPSQINSGVDADLERIILKCMEKDPSNRFQTADELRQVLNNYLSGRAVNVSEPTRIIGAAGDLGATKTRELSDSTRAMVRPVSGVSGQTNPPQRRLGFHRFLRGRSAQVQQEQDYRRRSRRNRRGWRCGGLRHRALWGRAGYGARCA